MLCCARVVLLGHWWGMRENHAPTHARGAWQLQVGVHIGINWQKVRPRGPAGGRGFNFEAFGAEGLS